MHENRETSRTSRTNQERDRSAKVKNYEADAHALEESDCAVVPMNWPEQRGAIICGRLGREQRGPRRTSRNPTRARHRAGNECPRDWTVCGK